MGTLYFASLLTTNKDRVKEVHDEPIVIDKGIQADTTFTFIDILPQSQSNSNFSFLHSNRTEVSYHKFSDLIKRANLWFIDNPGWQIVNCETVLIFFTCNSGVWNLSTDSSCFTLDNGQQSALHALRLWIKRSQSNYENNEISYHNFSSSNHHTDHHTNHHTNHHANHYTNPHTTHDHLNYTNRTHNQQSSKRLANNTDSNNDDLKNQHSIFTLKTRDFVPDNSEHGDHSKFEKLDQVLDKLNSAILKQELNAEDCITIETLYFPVDYDFILDDKLENTLHSFPSSYVCILRVFYIEKINSNESSLTSKLRKLNYTFSIQLKDFIPKNLCKGTFLKRPKFERLSSCIENAAKWIEQESRLHQLKYQNLIKELKNETNDFLFDFKNAQCIEIKTKILKHNIDSKIMAHTTDNGDYIRIFRVAYMKVVQLNDKIEIINEQSIKMTAKQSNLLNRSIQLIKNKQLNKSISSAHENMEERTIQNKLLNENEDNRSTIHLTSIIFTPTDSVTTISEMKRKIQNYTLTRCRDDQMKTDELSKYSRKPRILSAETVEIYTKNFSTEEIEKETENVFQFNRLGTMNNFLYFSFRIYLDDLDGRINQNQNHNENLKIDHKIKKSNQLKDDQKCVIL